MVSGRVTVLALGDALVFLVFSWIGRSSHREPVGAGALSAVVGTAAPFLVAWFLVAPLMGAYRAAPGTSHRAMLGRTARTWMIAGPLGLLLRAAILRRGIPPSFALITLLTNLTLLLVWRGLASLTVGRKAVSDPGAEG
jgi:hypothetical protein